MSLHLEDDAGTATTTASRDGGREAPDGRTRGPVRRWLSRLDPRLSPYLFVSPFFLLFAAFGLFPLAYTFWVSLRDWHLVGGDKGYVGLANYTRVLSDSWFWNAVKNTFGVYVLSTVPQLLLALVIAYLLNKRIRGRTLFRMGVLLPNITSTAVVAIVFGQLFGRDFGLVNWVLGGAGAGPVDWKADPLSSWVAISSMVNWRWTGYNALILLAAMQAIPREIYEAASLDGASAWRQFRRLTVPLLRPTLVFCVVISTIGNLQLFTEPLLFNAGSTPIYGGSLRQSQTVTMYLYEQAFTRYNFGTGSAVAWLLFLLVVVFSLVNVALLTRGGWRKGNR